MKNKAQGSNGQWGFKGPRGFGDRVPPPAPDIFLLATLLLEEHHRGNQKSVWGHGFRKGV